MLPGMSARGPVGRHERAISETIRRAQRAGIIRDLDRAAASGLRMLGRALDTEERRMAADGTGGYVVAFMHRELRAALTAYGLAPLTAGGSAGEPADDDATDLAAVLRLGHAARERPESLAAGGEP